MSLISGGEGGVPQSPPGGTIPYTIPYGMVYPSVNRMIRNQKNQNCHLRSCSLQDDQNSEFLRRVRARVQPSDQATFMESTQYIFVLVWGGGEGGLPQSLPGGTIPYTIPYGMVYPSVNRMIKKSHSHWTSIVFEKHSVLLCCLLITTDRATMS